MQLARRRPMRRLGAVGHTSARSDVQERGLPPDEREELHAGAAGDHGDRLHGASGPHQAWISLAPDGAQPVAGTGRSRSAAAAKVRARPSRPPMPRCVSLERWRRPPERRETEGPAGAKPPEASFEARLGTVRDAMHLSGCVLHSPPRSWLGTVHPHIGARRFRRCGTAQLACGDPRREPCRPQFIPRNRARRRGGREQRCALLRPQGHQRHRHHDDRRARCLPQSHRPRQRTESAHRRR